MDNCGSFLECVILNIKTCMRMFVVPSLRSIGIFEMLEMPKFEITNLLYNLIQLREQSSCFVVGEMQIQGAHEVL